MDDQELEQVEISKAGDYGDYESDFEPELLEIGDGPEILACDMKETLLSHPEGSFLAQVHDKSEQNVAALIEKQSSKRIEDGAARLDTILPEVRERIWRFLTYADLTRIRSTCRKFRDEIDNVVGIQLYLTDQDEDSLRLALTTTVQRLIINNIEMSTLGTLIPTNPTKLVDLKIQGPVSSEVIHEILRRCSNIHKFELMHHPGERDEDLIADDREWGSLKNWVTGKLLIFPESEIRYAYGCFNKLREFRFKSKGNERAVSENLISFGLLPFLHCVNSQRLRIIDIRTPVSPDSSKLITEALFETFLRSRSLTELRLHHTRTDAYTFQPIPNVDQEHRTSHHLLKFGEFHPFPQFEILDLEMPEHLHGYFDWITLLENQRRLRQFVWDVGGNYFGYPVEAIRQCAKSLETLTIRMVRCYRNASLESEGKPEFFTIEPLHEFIALKQLHLVAMEFSTSRFSRLDLLPKTIQCLQLECFQVLPEQLMTIHQTLPMLRLFSLSHWNDSRPNFLRSLLVIQDMIIGHEGKYRGLSFLEKCMYSSMPELNEINILLDKIREVCSTNRLSVDKVSGDNGVGFILVIGSGDDTEFRLK